MGTVKSWWRKLMGRGAVQPVAAKPPPAPPKAPQVSGLELTDAPATTKPSRVGAAGFDPYSSDAGYSKPHSWERVDHD
jgi:hypothetical protein